mgnify:CR=1 FL=1
MPSPSKPPGMPNVGQIKPFGQGITDPMSKISQPFMPPQMNNWMQQWQSRVNPLIQSSPGMTNPPVSPINPSINQPQPQPQSMTPPISKGAGAISDPNNNFMLNAIGGADNPGINPNYKSSPTVPITNTPQTNSQDLSIFNNPQKTSPMSFYGAKGGY